jgi:nucleoside-diphosphate-sugar epimerase
MRILIVGASGVLGRTTLPHLRAAGHDVVGTTRSPGKRAVLASLGATPELCDIYTPGAIDRVARDARPEIVVNFLTDLAAGPGPANSRIRVEGAPLVSAAARAAGARRLVVESIAFETSGASAAAVAALEEDAHASGLEALVLRFGLFWGPGTWSEGPPDRRPAVHVAEAGRRAAELIVSGAPGVHVVADPERGY